MEDRLLEYVDGELVIESETLKKLNELRLLKKQTDTEYKALTDAITKQAKVLTNGKSAKFSDYNLIKKGGNWGYELDTEKLENEYPEIYEKCLKITQEKITYTLSYAIREKKNV